MDDYERYEDDCEKIRKKNQSLLIEFETWLKTTGLAKKTISIHSTNIVFYINEYLLYEDATEPQDGVDSVNMFLGYWFIKKAMWSSQAAIRSNAASLKKFYTFMYEKDLISIEGLTELKETIKENMPEWLDTMARYEDLSIDDVW
jgi:site-specific recombinase XerD